MLTIKTTPPDSLPESLYEGYAYSYPHKTAYRHFDQPILLREVWRDEPRDALFLYIHIPFCGMRCGFCNLFTQVGAKEEVTARYLETLRRQAEIVRREIGEARFVRLAIGGGTPTYLDAKQLESVFDIVKTVMGANTQLIPVCVEVSPETLTEEKVALLAERGVSRISIGVQSFVESEVQAVGRSQHTAVVESALELIRSRPFEVLNIDLIYGMPGQTPESWRYSVKHALDYRPEELYLYPLYIRPLTGLGRTDHSWDDLRVQLYREAQELLLNNGYAQSSMRMFRLLKTTQTEALPYRCQEDGMVGLGCGARSYTRELHYCTEYAVGSVGVREIIARYLENRDEDFRLAKYGFRLDGDEQRRRYAMQSLLSEEGLQLAAYAERFHSDPFGDLPLLGEFQQSGYIVECEGNLALTTKGIEHSDQLGPALYSEEVRRRMRTFTLR